ncbi:unnamed protein product [Mycena citricolor]|uniref:Thioesterase domain-containing protein n=1 Tax=Mycena citricolor TaxID=2018698 RepID=A0AAD2HAR4_9AGAR|nr:unnamed protein product [Mycena citricolor]
MSASASTPPTPDSTTPAGPDANCESAFFLFQIDAVASLPADVSEDQIAIRACRELRTRRYPAVALNPAHITRDPSRVTISLLSDVQQRIFPAVGAEQDMVVPVLPVFLEHARSPRRPLKTTNFLPWEGCYLSIFWQISVNLRGVSSSHPQSKFSLCETERLRALACLEEDEIQRRRIIDEWTAHSLPSGYRFQAQRSFPALYANANTAICGSITESLSKVKKISSPALLFKEIAAIENIVAMARRRIAHLEDLTETRKLLAPRMKLKDVECHAAFIHPPSQTTCVTGEDNLTQHTTRQAQIQLPPVIIVTDFSSISFDRSFYSCTSTITTAATDSTNLDNQSNDSSMGITTVEGATVEFKPTSKCVRRARVAEVDTPTISLPGLIAVIARKIRRIPRIVRGRYRHRRSPGATELSTHGLQTLAQSRTFPIFSRKLPSKGNVELYWIRSTAGPNRVKLPRPVTMSSIEPSEALFDQVQTVLANYLTSSPLYAHLLSTIALTAVEKGHVTLRLVVLPVHVNSKSILHGSLSAAIVDLVGGLIAIAAGSPKTGVSTDLHVSFVSSAKLGDELYIEGFAERVGGTLAFTRVRIEKVVDSEGVKGGERVLVATGTHTKYVK